MKEMRERLIETMYNLPPQQVQDLIQEFDECGKLTRERIIFKSIPPSIEQLADALIEAGVILPRFKVGQKVWQFILTEESIREVTICYIVDSWSGNILYYERGDWLLDEKYLYATESEARAAFDALKEGI